MTSGFIWYHMWLCHCYIIYYDIWYDIRTYMILLPPNWHPPSYHGVPRFKFQMHSSIAQLEQPEWQWVQIESVSFWFCKGTQDGESMQEWQVQEWRLHWQHTHVLTRILMVAAGMPAWSNLWSCYHKFVPRSMHFRIVVQISKGAFLHYVSFNFSLTQFLLGLYGGEWTWIFPQIDLVFSKATLKQYLKT